MKTKAQILIVDDNAVMLKFLAGLLSDKYQVISKPNAYEAFKWLEEGSYPSLIISDLMTAEMDNRSFVKNLKVSGFYRNIPVVALSAILQNGPDAEELASMVDAFFPKPFNPVKLTETITFLLTDRYHANAA